MATPTSVRSVEEIYQEWGPQILETSRNRDSIARAISDAEGHGSTPAENVGAYQELKTATRAVDHVMFEFCRECQASGFANYSTSLQGRMAYSLATPPPWATIYVIRAQNLIHTSSSSSSSESASSAPPSPSRNNNVFAVRARHHGMAPTNLDRDHLLSLLRSRSQPMQEQPFHLPPLSSANSTSTWHPSEQTPGRVSYPGDSGYDQLKHHHLYEMREDKGVQLKHSSEWSEATRRRDWEAAERQGRRS